ncbi:MAG: 16S rRNA (cytosine(1402)-N(4))-methyltransferase RsmH [Oscillospiraceae bacterium]|nr:16S rRNA (cytosine(1402)-N(4))-methyltransferase RsmH [Oscillospiraceae bacterium]
MEFSHISVLLSEAVNALNINPDGVYVDATAGGGGHSGEILKRLSPNGRLVCIDQDPDAQAVLHRRFGEDGRVTLAEDNYSNIERVLNSAGIEAADGILMDIGVSSYQLDCVERGFSYHHDAPLDMRMSKQGQSAADLVNSLSWQELAEIFSKYGEEKFSARIAKLIVEERDTAPIENTLRLAEIIREGYPQAARRNGHPARKVFQALRIAVNDELSVLERGLSSAFARLSSGGRLAVITFHSLEDRTVKRRFLKFAEGCTCPPQFPVCVCGKKPEGRLISGKPIAPSETEVEGNPRSRTAKLRVVEKI